MAKIYPYRQVLAYCAEETFGQMPATPVGVKLVVLSDSLQRETENAAFGPTRDGYLGGKSVRHVSVTGRFTSHVFPEAYLDLIKAAMRGRVDTSGSNPYTHTIRPRGRNYSFTFERGTLDIPKYTRYNGCRVVGATFYFPRVGYSRVDYEVRGLRAQEYDAPFSPVLDEPANAPYHAEESALRIENVVQGAFIEGSVSIRVDTAVGRFSPGYQLAQEIWPGTVRASAQLTMYAENLVRLAWLTSTAVHNIELRFARESYSVRVKFGAARITHVSPPFIAAVGRYAQVIELDGAMDGAIPPIEVVVVNDKSSI